METNEPIEHQLLTIDEAAETLRISRATLYELFGAGELTSIKIGRRRLIERRAILLMLDRRRVSGL